MDQASSQNRLQPASVVKIRRMRGDENLIKKIKRPVQDEHKKAVHTMALSFLHSRESVHPTKVITQKMSPSVTGDKPVLLGKCHLLVTFEINASGTFSGLRALCELTVKNPDAQFVASLHPMLLSVTPRFQTPLTLRPPVKNSNALPPSTKARQSIPRIILALSPICENLYNLWITTFNPVECQKCPKPVLKMSFLEKDNKDTKPQEVPRNPEMRQNRSRPRRAEGVSPRGAMTEKQQRSRPVLTHFVPYAKICLICG
ncbi:MAG: hypothetical protein JWM04_53 [Verrucomicrobiales bacterium]|nr:hypothetical protein [Verrucomicrobiales bacterium]